MIFMSANNKTESVTFRLSANMINELRLEADENNLSLSTLVNQIIYAHNNWHKYATKAGFIPIPKVLQILFLDKITNDEIQGIAKKKTDTCKDSIIMLRKEYTIETFLDAIETWAKMSGFDCRTVTHEDKLRFIINHNMGEKWSLFLVSLIKHNLEDLLDKKVICELTDQTIMLEIERSALIVKNTNESRNSHNF